ncbi:transcription termination factor NusA [Murdochiella vaginalis]|uniref:transcription termination factor NusA n=1 Tax=Murdochiella vaginalis TaxID=1852373 RepID=UPI0008FE8D76|nr:transcription termination factor NusA [Murdochiella vaginalis]
MNKELLQALEELQNTKGISKKVILEAMAKALEKSYEKNFQDETNVEVVADEMTGDFHVYQLREVVDKVEDPIRQIRLEEAVVRYPKAQVGDSIRIEVQPDNFGRIAAQTARNIIIQKLRDAEREAVYDAYIDRMKEMIVGTVQRIDNNNVYINLGKTEGVITKREQIPREHLHVGDRVKLYVCDVRVSSRGPQVLLSRAHPNLVARLFEQEVPEINDGVVEIYSVSREAGSRTKIAVWSHDPNIDPIGACVGYKGNRVNLIVDELIGEKMDIIIYSEDPKQFIANALSPSAVNKVILQEEEHSAVVIVPDDQLSLAIGKEGQNVRLAARLTGWKIDIKGQSQYDADPSAFDADTVSQKPLDLFALPEENSSDQQEEPKETIAEGGEDA